MGKHKVSSCNWTKLRMGKNQNLKLETLEGHMRRERKMFEGGRRLPSLTFIYSLAFFTTIHLT